MSVIDRALQELQGGGAEPPVLSVHDAMAAILIASVSADGALGVDESSRIQHVMSMSRLFKAASGTEGAGSVERAVTLLQEHGMDSVLAACAEALPPELHATAFAIAVDLVLCDGRIETREKAYIDRLQAALDVDDRTALKIVEVMIIKNRV
jgi:hypothetical protein